MSVAEFWSGLKVAGKMIRMTPEDRRAFEALELRVRDILPEEYQDTYEDVKPVSMGTAALKYGRDGRVAWHDTWGSFCDLAMAGGPPHKGKLLMAASQREIEAEPERYRQVVEEICRGIEMVSFLPARQSAVPGWVRVECQTEVTAGWLARAIAMENVSARCDGKVLELPAGPAYRIEKEIKNVITAIAKTGHYWLDHTGPAQQREIAELFATIAAESPLIQPALIGHDFSEKMDPKLGHALARRIQELTGLPASDAICDGWAGVVFPSVKAAIWMMRGMVVSNVFARREETMLFVPVNPASDPSGDIVVRLTARFTASRGLAGWYKLFEAMIKLSVMYPDSESLKFDMDYYLDTHIPLLRRLTGENLKGVSIDRAVRGTELPTPYAVIAHLLFETLDTMQAQLAEHGAALMGDIPNYTNAQPVIQVSETT